MKKISLAKLTSLVFACVMLFAMLAIGVCAEETTENIVPEDVFTFKGYSLDESGDACFGFTLNQEAKATYEEQIGKTVDIGLVIAIYEDGKSPIDAEGNVTGKAYKMSLNDLKNTSYSFKLVNFQSLGSTKYVVTPYVTNGTNVYYYENGDVSETVGGVSYDEIVLATHECEAEVVEGKAPTCEETGLTEGAKCSVCGKILTAQEEIPALGHANEDGDYECDNGCGKLYLPAADETLTLEQAIALGKLFAHNKYTNDKYYVTATIKEVYNTTYGNMYVTVDGETTFTVYGTYSADGSKRYDALPVKPVAGETITLYGIIGQYNSNPQMKNAWIQHNNEVVVKEPTCTEGGQTTSTCKYCGTVNVSDITDALGHDFDDTGVCTRCNVSNHEHDYTYNSVVTAPTCTTVGFTTNYCECGQSEKVDEVAALGHTDTYGNFKCEVCGENAFPANGTTLTIAQAIQIANLHAHNTYTANKYYVTGIITSVYNATYGNMYITDGTNTFTIYGTYSADGSTRYDKMTDKPVAGYTVTIYGAIGIYSGAPQIKNGWIIEYAEHECEYTSVVTAPTCTAEGYTTYKCDACGDSYVDNYVDATGHKYNNGICSVCGDVEGSVDVKTEMSVSKSHTDMATIAGVTAGQNTGSIQGKEIALNEDITVVCEKGNSTSNPCIYSESIRLYQGGATITIKAADGCEMTTIIIHLASKSGGQGPISVTGGTASALSDYTYTITVDSGVTEVVVTTTGADKNNRLYVDNIEVEYKK
ncbi:MAG: hypothetical protein J6A90_02490 [Clostridia bacterium]|nr:hypothetical protein [Clostridia bacterium]